MEAEDEGALTVHTLPPLPVVSGEVADGLLVSMKMTSGLSQNAGPGTKGMRLHRFEEGCFPGGHCEGGCCHLGPVGS